MQDRLLKRMAAVSTLALLVACADGGSDPARLNALLDSGLDEKSAARLDAQLAKTLARGKDTDARDAAFASLDTAGNAVPAGTLVQVALARNTRIGTAAQKISEADAERMNAIFGYLPQVSLNYSQDQVDQTVEESDNEVFELGEASYPVTVMQVRIDQPIFDLGRIFNISYARNARSQAEVDYIATVRDVVYEVLDTYVVAAQAETRAKYLRQRMSLMNRQINSQTTLEEAGLDDMVESSSLRSERASIASEEALETARYTDALGTLSRLTGTVITDLAQLSIPGNVMGSERRMSADDLVARGLQENPRVMSAALAVVGADLDRKRALAADFSPVIAAYATLEDEDRGDSRFGGGSVTSDQTIGVQLTVPLFNATGTGYAMFPAKARMRQGVLEYFSLKRELETEIRATHARLTQLSKAASQASSAAGQASRALATERNRLESGESADLAVAVREMRLSQTRERTAFYQAEYLRSWLRLQYLSGADLRQGF